jgi:UDP-2-acetamido-3-amino-2,3-dideoxy-glucuronate N-acetyltransferase
MTSLASSPGIAVFVHPDARVETPWIGARTRIWAFSHILEGARIGADCNICDHTFVENDVVIGDRVTVKSGVQVWDGVTLEDDVFVGPNATFTNDPFPRSRRVPETFVRTVIRRGASIGANATLLPGVTVGSYAMVGAGAVVTRDVPPRAIVMGNPARVTAYVDTRDDLGTQMQAGGIQGGDAKFAPQQDGNSRSETVLAGGARLLGLPRITDARGHLSFAELGQSLPFSVARYFLVFGVPSRQVRGEHAHRELEQFLICVQGSLSVRVFDGSQSSEVRLDRPDLGLYIPAMTWATQYKYSSDAVLLVLASDVYREEDYIRDLDRYCLLVGCKVDCSLHPAFPAHA